MQVTNQINIQENKKSNKDTKDNINLEKIQETLSVIEVKEEIVKQYDSGISKLNDLTININQEENKEEEQKKKKKKKNKKKKPLDETEDNDEKLENEKKKQEEEEAELKKKKENKYKPIWDAEFANTKILNTRVQDNSMFRVLKSWSEKEGYTQTYIYII